MKILITANTSWNLAHFREALITALIADGHQIVAVSPVDQSVQKLTNMGLRHIPLNMDNKGIGPFKDLKLICEFRKLFRQEAPDLILSFTIKNNIYGAIAARSFGFPFLPNVSGLGTAFLGSRWLEAVAIRLYRFAFRPLRTVIFQNSDDLNIFLGNKILCAEQAVVVPGSGIDLCHFDPVDDQREPDHPVTFLLIARMLRDKGVFEFAEAAQKVLLQHPNAKFQLLGSAEAENRTAIDSQTINQWVAEGCLEYLGETSDVRPYIAAADCIVLPSYREGMPRTLLEAAAMARPLIATDVPGCRNVVINGVNGFLCRAKDAEDLAAAIVQMIEAGANQRTSMGRAGRQKMEDEFDQTIVVDAYRKAIGELV